VLKINFQRFVIENAKEEEEGRRNKFSQKSKQYFLYSMSHIVIMVVAIPSILTTLTQKDSQTHTQAQAQGNK